MRVKRAHQKGQGVIFGIGLLLITLIVSALCVDFGFYFVNHNVLQSAADSASLAAAKELWVNPATTPAGRHAASRSVASTYVGKYSLNGQALAVEPATDVTIGFVDPITKKYNPATFATASSSPGYAPTGGYNAVRVLTRKTTGSPSGTIPTILAGLFGINSMESTAISVAMLDNTVATVNLGLRPIYGCLEQYNAVTQMLAANPGSSLEDYTVSLYGPTFEVEGAAVAQCPVSPSGNWGFADFRNDDPNAVGMQRIGDWFESGYPDPVEVNDPVFSSQPGNSGVSPHVTDPLDDLIASGDPILVPLLSSWDGNGSNNDAFVKGFAGFVVTSYKFRNKSNPSNLPKNGPDFINGYFVEITCTEAPGICSTGNTVGGSVVNLRLVR